MTNQQVSIRTLPNFFPDTQDVYTVSVTGFERYLHGEQIKTVVTKDAETVDHWIQHIYSDYKEDLDRAAKTKKGSWDYHRFMVALDVEWKPTTHDNQAPIAILKICVSSWYSTARCLIFRIQRCYQLPKSLQKFLEDDNLRFVGLDIDAVARKLEKEFDLSVKRAFDLRDLFAVNNPDKKKEVKGLDLMGLAKIVFRSKEIEIERARDVIVSNWNQKYLTQPQIMYAVLDAYVTFKIGEELDYLIDD